ncbi:MAG: endosialidase [Lachnospiraceae bacterium]|nr:endosialidase [Lachnospiraceae bacterium]
MAGITDLICTTEDGKLNFGNFDLDSKQKRSDFAYEGDMYKVKTFKEITKLERNGMFVYESVPGTVVKDMLSTGDEVTFSVEGWEDSSITLELEPEMEYGVTIAGADIGKMKTNLGGKLSLSVEMEPGQAYDVKVVKL